MKNIIENIWTKTIIILILFIIILYLFPKCNGDKEKDPDKTYEYITETIRIPEPYIVEIKGDPIYTPPLILTEYLPSTPTIDSVKYVPGEIQIYIDSLKTALTYKEGFLTNFPKASKLLNMDLKLDSLSVTTLSTDAQVRTFKYPLLLNHFKYQWVNDSLHRTKIREIKPLGSKLNWKELYLNGGYSMITKTSLLGFEYNLTPGRFKFDIEAKSTLETKPQLFIEGKVGFRLFK